MGRLVITKNPAIAKIIEDVLSQNDIEPHKLIGLNSLLNNDSALNLVQSLKEIPKTELVKLCVALNNGGEIQSEDNNIVDVLAVLGVNISIPKDNEMAVVEELNNPLSVAQEGEMALNNQGGEMAPNLEDQNMIVEEDFGLPENMYFEEIPDKFAQQAEDIDEDDKALEDFMIQKDPQTQEEKNKAVEEFFEKRYYLTGARLFESLQQTDAFNALDSNTQSKIRDAYLKCVHPSDLLDPNYLNDKIDLGISGPVRGFESIHMIALGGTFVGYQMENAQDVPGQAPTSSIDEGSLSNQIQGINSMSTASKDETILEAKKKIEEKIKELFKGGNVLEDLDKMLPLEVLIGAAITEFADNASGTREGTSAKMYAKELAKDFKGNSENQMEKLCVKIDLSSVDWSNDEQREQILKRFSKLNEQAKDFQIENPFNTIHINYTIKDPSDIDKLIKIEEDLSKVTSNLEIDVTIEEQDPERLADLQARVGNRNQGIAGRIMDRITERLNERAMGQVLTMATRTMAPQFAAMPGGALLMSMAENAIADTMGISRGNRRLTPHEQLMGMAAQGIQPFDTILRGLLNPNPDQDIEDDGMGRSRYNPSGVN